jgi:hypothetical protein
MRGAGEGPTKRKLQPRETVPVDERGGRPELDRRERDDGGDRTRSEPSQGRRARHAQRSLTELDDRLQEQGKEHHARDVGELAGPPSWQCVLQVVIVDEKQADACPNDGMKETVAGSESLTRTR